ncbi:hypothetical protein A3C89_03655 [Candidatus Kaiserbacteria bacterium RIFCSPHIGHO2_02_FULL_50_50]|uniref:Uncharacterized protein n=1 Tax=Candidatus Kaiserbacteria bacterium RIFCSPHIGHO2_02_FULL_50_50 TaxID=1798492 RepID=A0A1F6DC05_9BACT|nr:MAG: hypothetical protein A3C89_03655 [Candidatus Kaiserbacteria bacterium RIFCSPHIGHO2_02_FULL_50_50]OGG88556.1 MAG: hypothetical protein A3G62_03550 [Candidatus Kaiserbacteria bacterium RIFCSPLOWO2_12_FULL_50_10]
MTHTSFPKSIVIRITILVLLLCVIVGIKVYATRDMNAILRDIRAHYTQVATIRTTRDASVSLLSSFTAIKGNESRIRAALPSADYIVPFRDAVEDAATRVSATVSVTYGNPEATTFLLPPRENSTSSEQVYSIATSISIEGDARALEQFLTELEALPYYFTLLDMKSTSAQQDGWEAGTRTSLRGVLYTIHEI